MKAKLIQAILYVTYTAVDLLLRLSAHLETLPEVEALPEASEREVVPPRVPPSHPEYLNFSVSGEKLQPLALFADEAYEADNLYDEIEREDAIQW